MAELSGAQIRSCRGSSEQAGERDHRSHEREAWEVSQKIYINAYMWNLEKWYRSYLQSRNRDTGIENKYMDTKGAGRGRIGRLGLACLCC